jgi:hypothetical protein
MNRTITKARVRDVAALWAKDHAEPITPLQAADGCNSRLTPRHVRRAERCLAAVLRSGIARDENPPESV